MSPQSQWYESPDLAGDNVLLVQLRPHHAAGVLAAADDDEVFRWMSFRRPTELPDAEALVNRYLTTPDQAAWAQIDQRSNELAGITTYYDIDPVNRSVAIGSTWLGKRFWRTPVNTEAKLLLLTRAFDVLGAARVVWHADSMNQRSLDAIERLGATREGTLRKHRIRPDGSWRDTAVASMLDDEWPSAKKRLSKSVCSVQLDGRSRQ